MSESIALREGWETILDAIRVQVSAALAGADARAAALPSSSDEPAATVRRGELVAGTRRLEERTAQLGASTAEVDRVLAESEEFLRWRLAEAESLRSRLAAWAARAIG